jgi:GNAT superfamily N-acetyltransferase
MIAEAELVFLSAIDEERFGIRSARAVGVTAENLSTVLEFCKREGVKFLIARCPVADLRAAQAMEGEGFFLTDTLVYFSRDLNNVPEENDRGVLVRPMKENEVDQVKTVAAEAFGGYYGHYHADSRLPKEKSDEAYVSWAVRSCSSPGVADVVLVAEIDDVIMGLATLRLNHEGSGEGILFCVSPQAQRKGIYRAFIVSGMRACAGAGATRMLVSTQIQNTAVQKVWAREGFEPSHAYHTFHKWFDTSS